MRLNKIMQSNWAFTIVVACSLLLSIPFWTSASNIIVPSSGLTPSGYYLTDGTNFFLPPFMSLVTKPVQGNFSWVNQGTATDTVTNGGLVLHVIPTGTLTSALRQEAMGVTTVLTAAFSATIAIVPGQTLRVGVGLRNSSTGKALFAQTVVSALSSDLEIMEWTSPTVPSTVVYNLNSVFPITPFPQFIGIQVIGGNIIFFVSADGGSTFLPVFTQPVSTFFVTAPDNWCYMGEPGNVAIGTFADDVYITIFHWKTQ